MRCWEWERAQNSKGYGIVWVGGKLQLTHRVVYEEIIGPIPAGLDLDHLCRNRACYNPEHLEPVTRKENVRRGKGHGSETHCPQGHPYSGYNLRIVKRGKGRECITCRRKQNREYYHRRKENAV